MFDAGRGKFTCTEPQTPPSLHRTTSPRGYAYMKKTLQLNFCASLHKFSIVDIVFRSTSRIRRTCIKEDARSKVGLEADQVDEPDLVHFWADCVSKPPQMLRSGALC